MSKNLLIFAGSSHLPLANLICKQLNTTLAKMNISQFADGEIHVQILEHVNNQDVFIVQSIAHKPNDYLCELFIIVDALKRSGARNMTAIIPYFGYSRQDRQNKPGQPITAKLVADLLITAGISRLITCDLHTDQLEGFFSVPVEHIRCQQLLSNSLQHLDQTNTIVIAPDIGSSRIAEKFAKFLNMPLGMIRKERFENNQFNTSLLGDVKKKNVLLIDDICSTAHTLLAAAKICQVNESLTINAVITHGLFNHHAIQHLKNSPINTVYVTDTVNFCTHSYDFIQKISIASLIVEKIRFSIMN